MFYTDLWLGGSETLYSGDKTPTKLYLFLLRWRLLCLVEIGLYIAPLPPFARGCLTVLRYWRKAASNLFDWNAGRLLSSVRGVRLRAIFTEPRIIYKVDWRLKRIAPTFWTKHIISAREKAFFIAASINGAVSTKINLTKIYIVDVAVTSAITSALNTCVSHNSPFARQKPNGLR